MKRNFKSFRGKLIITIALIVFLFAGCSKNELRIVSPENQSVFTTNTPGLAWSQVDCEYYEVWIDGVRMDSLSSFRNSLIPFPLSFGKHHWFVKAIINGEIMQSDTSWFSIDDSPLSILPDDAQLLRYNWRVQSSAIDTSSGPRLSTEYREDEGWYPTSLPATALTVLVRNGVYPNPYHNINNTRIPDINDIFNSKFDLLKYSHIPNQNPWKKPYWYRTEFELENINSNKMVWLNFNEINYRAEVWLNGRLLADAVEMVGMERQFRFNIDAIVNKQGMNYLAIAVFPPDNPGEPAPDPVTPLADPGTNMADGIISRDYTKWDAIGWDWQPAIRDRDMGITEDVYLSFTGNMEIDNLYVTSDLPLPDTSSADLTVSFDVINYDSKVKSGKITGTIDSGNGKIEFQHDFSINANETKSFFWTKEIVRELQLENPKLWWPHDYGLPNLYTLSLDLKDELGESTKETTRFGIREVETFIGANERIFKINGKEIYCKAGNWVIDMMLNSNAHRYTDEILLTKNANLNLLRIWGPTGVPPEVFYEAADEHGVMLWQDFLSDYWGTMRNTPGYRPNESLYEKATVAIVKKYRNHPSLIIWCGGNEGVNPGEEVIVKKILPLHDGRDSRFYLKGSTEDGIHGGGPYQTLKPEAYFTEPRMHGFSSEIGPSGVPDFESVLKFMPDIGKSWLEDRFPIDGVWAYHDANDWPGSDTRKFSSYDSIVRFGYGPPSGNDINGVQDYLDKCQLVNYDVYRASIEAINRQLWTNSSGFALWKSNSSWPSLTWQIYDWYLQAHAGYYGAKKASEPLHIQYNRNDRGVVVINAGHSNIDSVTIKAALFNSELKELWKNEASYSLDKNAVTNTNWQVPENPNLNFLKLSVTSPSGDILSENFYWLEPDDDFTELSKLPVADFDVNITKVEKVQGAKYKVTLKNTGSSLVYMLALKLKDKDTKLEVLPSFWSDNYLNILPGEHMTVYVELNEPTLRENLILETMPYNQKKRETDVP